MAKNNSIADVSVTAYWGHFKRSIVITFLTNYTSHGVLLYRAGPQLCTTISRKLHYADVRYKCDEMLVLHNLQIGNILCLRQLYWHLCTYCTLHGIFLYRAGPSFNPSYFTKYGQLAKNKKISPGSIFPNIINKYLKIKNI